MGKTGLIKHIFSQYKSENAFFFYIDIYDTTSLAQFTKTFAEAVFSQQISSMKARVLKEIATVFASIRPTITADPLTGMPQCHVDIKPQTEETTLQQIFSYLEKARKPCYVAFDEFQVIADYKECQMEASLRKYIQQLTNVRFIFAGSKKHVMAEMFLSHTRPFYQSTQITYIREIDEKPYYEFAKKHFEAHKQHIEEDVFHEIYEIVKGHTWYMQILLNRLYQSGINDITLQIAKEILNTIILENEPAYQMYCNLVAPRQRALMHAIAKEGTIKEPQSNDFIRKYGIGTASSSQSALDALIDKELVYDDNGVYSIYDKFLSLWLAR